MKTPTNEQVLNLNIEESDAGDGITIKDYLKKLLIELWVEGEGFSGKRPFGNSGWEYELYEPLIKANYIKGSFDEDDCIEDCDREKGNLLILHAIESL